MPELPEVETVRRGLNRLIKGKTIKDVNVLYDKIIVGSKAEFCKKLSGKKLLDVDRRGKYLLFRFSGDLTMVSHLRMEGKYFVRQKGEPVEKHTHVIFYLMDGSELHYNDVRKFGRMELFKTGEETTLSGISKLGPEPTEKNFDSQKFYEGLQKKKKPIKTALLDQTLVAHPKDKFALILVGDLAQFIDANAGICCSFLQRQVALFPDRNLSGLGPSILLMQDRSVA